MSLLITRPDYEPATKYLSCWSEEIIKVANSKALKVVDLQGEKAKRSEFIGRLSKVNPSLVVLNGHGDENSITGQDEEVLIEVGDNHQILNSRITYAVSCNCGKTLGPKVVENGDATFIGYDDKFVFTSDRKCLTRPLEDKRAQPFMEASNHVAISLLKGHKASDASLRSKSMFEKSYKKLLSSKADPNALQDARFLWWNMMHQVCLGNGEATIY
ncbi:MAG: hypothetical protein AAB592_00545 [Patescibacteria group bacterium]